VSRLFNGTSAQLGYTVPFKLDVVTHWLIIIHVLANKHTHTSGRCKPHIMCSEATADIDVGYRAGAVFCDTVYCVVHEWVTHATYL